MGRGGGEEADFLEGAGEAGRKLLCFLDMVGILGNDWLWFPSRNGEEPEGKGMGVLDPEFPFFRVSETVEVAGDLAVARSLFPAVSGIRS